MDIGVTESCSMLATLRLPLLLLLLLLPGPTTPQTPLPTPAAFVLFTPGTPSIAGANANLSMLMALPTEDPLVDLCLVAGKAPTPHMGKDGGVPDTPRNMPGLAEDDDDDIDDADDDIGTVTDAAEPEAAEDCATPP